MNSKRERERVYVLILEPTVSVSTKLSCWDKMILDIEGGPLYL